jgi:hypothetical protein
MTNGVSWEERREYMRRIRRYRIPTWMSNGKRLSFTDCYMKACISEAIPFSLTSGSSPALYRTGNRVSSYFTFHPVSYADGQSRHLSTRTPAGRSFRTDSHYVKQGKKVNMRQIQPQQVIPQSAWQYHQSGSPGNPNATAPVPAYQSRVM